MDDLRTVSLVAVLCRQLSVTILACRQPRNPPYQDQHQFSEIEAVKARRGAMAMVYFSGVRNLTTPMVSLVKLSHLTDRQGWMAERTTGRELKMGKRGKSNNNKKKKRRRRRMGRMVTIATTMTMTTKKKTRLISSGTDEDKNG